MDIARLYVRVLSLLGSDRRLGWMLAIANVALSIALFAEPVLFGKVIDQLTRSDTSQPALVWANVWPLLAAWVGFGLFTIFCATGVALYADRLSHRRRHIVLAEYFAHILSLPHEQHTGVHSGRLMKIMLQGTDALWWLWLSFFRDHLAAIVSLLVLVPVALYVNWRLALLLIFLAMLFGLMMVLVLRKTQTLQQQVESHHSDLAEHAADTLGNVAIVQSFARVGEEVNALRQISDRVLRAQMPALSWWALVTVFTRSATTLTVLLIVVVGTWMYTRQMVTVGEIATFIGLSGMVIGRLEQVVGFANRLSQDAPRLREYFSVLDLAPSIKDRPDAIEAGRLKGRLTFKEVSYTYDGRRLAVDRISFEVEPGETIALVGTSGAGKSTALSLLYRAFDPSAGQILVDGRDIREYRLESLRKNIGVVFQEGMLFNRSIADNLYVGNPEASPEAIRDAAIRAQAIEFIERHPQGFETVIGERGRSLSGGERQRLSIARVILKDPPILILDEATSALDTTTEARLMQALDEVTRDRTTLIIAHRLATVRKADRILVFEQGRIVESGSYQSLVEQGGRFASLVKEQQTGILNL